MMNAQPAASDETGLLLRALQQSERPLTADQLRNSLPSAVKPSKDRLAQLLREQAEQGQILSGVKGKSPVYWMPSQEESVRQAMLQALAERPLTQPKLSACLKALLQGWPKDWPKQTLERLAHEGLIRLGAGKSPTYWAPGAEQRARETMLSALAERPRTEKEFLGDLKPLLGDWPPTQLKLILEQLRQEGRFYKLPPLAGKAEILSLQPADPRDYLRGAIQGLKDAVRQLAQKLAPAGVSEQQLYTAVDELWRPELPTPVSAPAPTALERGQLLLNRMAQIEPGAVNGALVSLRDLRRALRAEIPEKADFDQAALHLFREGRVDLTWHHHPSALSAEERDEMVTDGQGNYYNGIVLRS